MSSQQFYDPILDAAGLIAQQYNLSIADVVSLLVKANRDEALVRSVLEKCAQSQEARAARASGKAFDLVAHTRALLEAASEQGT